MDFGFHWDTTYKNLPSFFYQTSLPVAMPRPQMFLFNHGVASELCLRATELDSADGARFFCGHWAPESLQPLAQAYAGHQFGRFTMLGDGRAVLYGEHQTDDGRRYDVHLKGTGPTPYSRRGDGRAALGPMLREYVVSEAMHALGIPSTRSLAVLTTGEHVYRQDVHPGAILVRIAQSHLRVGTFEYAGAFHEGPEMVRVLADYAIKRHHADLFETADAARRYEEFARRVTSVQMQLVADWMRVGFIHGVMNTDNMSISGETIDYGPCAFMDHYDPMTVFSSIDHDRRYAFSRQPAIMHWNLARFWQALLPILHTDKSVAIDIATQNLRDLPKAFEDLWLQMMREKLGWSDIHPDDAEQIQQLLNLMVDQRLDYTQTFTALARSLSGDLRATSTVGSLGGWGHLWRRRVEQQQGGVTAAVATMRRMNPVYIPRNHLVEEALLAAETTGDQAHLNQLLMVLKTPYQEQLAAERYEHPQGLDAAPYKTFCGT